MDGIPCPTYLNKANIAGFLGFKQRIENNDTFVRYPHTDASPVSFIGKIHSKAKNLGLFNCQEVGHQIVSCESERLISTVDDNSKSVLTNRGHLLNSKS